MLQRRLETGGDDHGISRSETTDADEIIRVLSARIHAGGLVVAHQELFSNPTSEYADIVLPAMGWGEDDFIRYNAQRRLKLYARFQDPPLHPDDATRIGERDPLSLIHRPTTYRHSPKQDWRIFRDVAHEIGRFMDRQAGAGNYFYNKLSNTRQNYFAWDSSAEVADDVAVWSHRGLVSTGKRASMLGDVFLYGVKRGIVHDNRKNTGIVHQVLGIELDGEGKPFPHADGLAPHLTRDEATGPYYTIPGESAVYGNTIATNGILLPGVGIDSDNKPLKARIELTGHLSPHSTEVRATLQERLDALDHLEGTLRVDRALWGPMNFVLADWGEIEPYFDRINARSDNAAELSVTNGRFNHLWNNMFHHLRNEYVNERWPEDMPGTVLEVNPDWAKSQSIENGQVVHVSTGASSFTAISSLQESVAKGSAFAMFSYPLPQSGEEAFKAYANNVTDGYFDGINPIAALKYGRATIRPAENPHDGSNRFVFPEHFAHRVPRLGPTFEQRKPYRAEYEDFYVGQ